MYNVAPFFPCFLLNRHQFGTIIYMKDNRLVFITDTPAENRCMISVAQDKTFQMCFRCFPKEIGVQFRSAITGPVGRFIQYADTHFICHIYIKAGINLCMRADCISVHTFNGSEPSPCVATCHLWNTHEMPGVSM